MTCPVMHSLNEFMKVQDSYFEQAAYCEDHFDDSYLEFLADVNSRAVEFVEEFGAADVVVTTLTKLEGLDLEALTSKELLTVFSDIITFAEEFRENEKTGEAVDRITLESD